MSPFSTLIRILVIGALVMCVTPSPAAAQAHGARASVSEVEVVDRADFAGRYFRTASAEPRTAVILLNGSDGGFPPDTLAHDLASAGYPTLALAWLQDQSGLPASVPRTGPVPLERVFVAIDWLRSRPEVAADRIVLMGVSRGAELALLVATRRPDLGGVIAFSPGSHVWGGVSHPQGVQFDIPMWSLAGTPLPWLSNRPDFQSPIHDWFALAPERADAIIPVERIACPLMLISSSADGLWPSEAYAGAIVARLRASGFPWPLTQLTYPDASHLLMGPGPAPTEFAIPGTAFVVDYGGSPEGTRRARDAAWAAAKLFLRDIDAPPEH